MRRIVCVASGGFPFARSVMLGSTLGLMLGFALGAGGRLSGEFGRVQRAQVFAFFTLLNLVLASSLGQAIMLTRLDLGQLAGLDDCLQGELQLGGIEAVGLMASSPCHLWQQVGHPEGSADEEEYSAAQPIHATTV